MPDRCPRLLLHCHHSLGLGHLVRSLTLAEALAARFRVTLLCGGELPSAVVPPPGVELVPLPPQGHSVVRRDRVLAAFRATRPAAVVVELFPFGRRKLAGELVPLLEAARSSGAVTACSVRDLLVRARDDQDRHDERASLLAGRLLDAVLVHADPRFARLEETFRPRTPLRVPVHHTGFVARPRRAPPGGRRERVVVSAGGGRVGGPLLRAAVEAYRLRRRPTTIVAGPFLPEDEWRHLQALSRGANGLELRRSVPDLGAELARASVSISQCGYNTALDVLQAGVPALVVPFAAEGEDEQTRRAERLARLGAVRMLDASALDANRLAAELKALDDFRPRPLALDLDGAIASARILEELAA
jgi:predicted glycosyltransferase